jgi:hypothetical protein
MVDSTRLRQLMSDLEIAEVLSLVSLRDVAGAWCRYTARPHIDGVVEEDPDEWAVLFVMGWGIDELDEPDVRALLDLLVEQAPDDDVLEVVGAGPLENFVNCHDEGRLRWIEQRAAISARFRQALRHVWIWSLEPGVFARVERAAGAPLARPAGNEIDYIPGDLPGTVHVRVNGVTVYEFDEVGNVAGFIEALRRHS